MSRGGPQYEIQNMEDEDMFDSLMEQSNEKLILLDVHKEWCGPCAALVPTLSKLMLDTPSSEERIVIKTCSADKFTEKIQVTLPGENPIQLSEVGCHPLFLIYRFNSCIGVVQGVDGPAILALVDINIPPVPEKDAQ